MFLDSRLKISLGKKSLQIQAKSSDFILNPPYRFNDVNSGKLYILDLLKGSIELKWNMNCTTFAIGLEGKSNSQNLTKTLEKM